MIRLSFVPATEPRLIDFFDMALTGGNPAEDSGEHAVIAVRNNRSVRAVIDQMDLDARELMSPDKQ